MKSTKLGMTIIELLIVIVVIGLLAGIGAFGYGRMQESSVIKQHRNTAINFSDTLNELYSTGIWPDDSLWTKGHYPSIHELNNNLTKITEHHSGISSNLEILPATTPSTSEPLGSYGNQSDFMETNYDKLIYQPIDVTNNMVCQEPGRCTKFNIYYFLKDKSGNFIVSEPIASKYQ